MPLTARPRYAPGDTITSAWANILDDDFSVLDLRTGGDPGAAGKLMESNGSLGAAWTTPAVNDTTAPSADSGAISTLLSNIGYQLKAIIGGAGWKTAPGASIAALVTADATNAAAAATAQATAAAALPKTGGILSGSVSMNAGNLNVSPGSVTAASADFTALTKGTVNVLNETQSGARYFDLTNAGQTMGVQKTLTLGNGSQIKFGTTGNPDLYVIGTIGATGIKSAIVPGPDGMLHSFAATEATRMYFEDYGSAYLQQGRVRVEIPEDYRFYVDTEADYYVWLTPHGDARVWIEETSPTAFVIGGSEDIRVDWRITALRKDLNQERLEVCAAPPILTCLEPDMTDKPVTHEAYRSVLGSARSHWAWQEEHNQRTSSGFE